MCVVILTSCNCCVLHPVAGCSPLTMVVGESKSRSCLSPLRKWPNGSMSLLPKMLWQATRMFVKDDGVVWLSCPPAVMPPA